MIFTRKINCLPGKNFHSLMYRMLQWFRRIIDHRYEYALRLFRKTDTGVVRLQASAQTGALKRNPIGTSFITHQINSPTWLSRDNPRVVHIVELQQYIFTEEYDPQKTTPGAFDLTFIMHRGTAPKLVDLV